MAGLPQTSAAKAARKLSITDRRRQAALLLRAGLTQHQVAAQLGVSEATISSDVAALKALLQAAAVEDVAEWRARELLALDGDEARLRAGWEPLAKGGLLVYDRILAIMARRAGLLALDLPARKADPRAGAAAELDALLQDLGG